MRGKGVYSVVGQNLKAFQALNKNNKKMISKPKMCWKCQKEKDTKDGYLKILPGLYKFICKDCLDAKEKS